MLLVSSTHVFKCIDIKIPTAGRDIIMWHHHVTSSCDIIVFMCSVLLVFQCSALQTSSSVLSIRSTHTNSEWRLLIWEMHAGWWDCFIISSSSSSICQYEQTNQTAPLSVSVFCPAQTLHWGHSDQTVQSSGGSDWSRVWTACWHLEHGLHGTGTHAHTHTHDHLQLVNSQLLEVTHLCRASDWQVTSWRHNASHSTSSRT